VMEENGYLISALACPPDPPEIAWVRLFTYAAPLTGPEAWLPLWEAVRGEIRAVVSADPPASVCVAAIALQPWFESILCQSGFDSSQRIVLLEWKDRPLPDRRPLDGIIIRRMLLTDLAAVVETDAASFAPLWCNSLTALRRAYSQAIQATVAVDDSGRVIAYQLSTGNPFGAHLARLAVRPVAQGRGIGEALVTDLLHKLLRRGPARLTVNTQDDNRASLALYEKIGFIRTGETFPVLTFPIREA
jgi:ribosomal-protein-alanine N-acetyltransferase